MPKRKGEENLKPTNTMTPEERKEFSQKGARVSAEVRRKRKQLKEGEITMKNLVLDFMGKITTPQRKSALKGLGFEDEDCTNINAFIAKLYTKFMGGDIRAGELLVTLGGLTGEEQRRDAEEARKTIESKARIEAMRANMGNEMNVSSGDNEGSVIIYLPEIEKDDKKEE